MTLNEILNTDLEKLKPLYIISSEDRYILTSFKEKFVKKFIPEEIRGFNYTYLEDIEDFPVVVKNQANTPPMMADRRFIIARTSTYFSSKQGKEELLISLFHNFPGTTIMLILVDGKLNNKLKLVKEAKESAVVIENISAPKYADLDKWIMAEFKKRGKNIDRTSVKFLEQMFSNNLQRLESEIEKITLYKMDDSRVTLDDLMQIVSKDRLIEDNLIFSLTDAIMSRKTGEAIKILKDMLQGGAVPLAILSTMTWQIRLLLSVKVLKEEGKSIASIARILKSHQYPVKKCYNYSSNFSEEELEILLEKFLEANINIVTGKYEAEMALELAIAG